ncbi:hypothetical protein NVV95_08910 [Herbiconiux sp. CPCC 205716]|uniref:Uncharacterized protein n=1 Tax=Herbiconiux gentiana TaxID=2970912 RepID=A0ABT2GEL8_9MICO|nr:hypothetical protein [Herbiconiux gentiana]MCS5714671.1 hypothetical protein [Herbiconiux gentiana]
MDRIFYAGDSILTGSAIARALLEYAEALAKADTSATVEIPTRLDDGRIGRSTFLVGPASQLVSDAEPSPWDEIVDEQLTAYFREQTQRLRFSAPGGKASSTESTASDDGGPSSDDGGDAWVADL